MLIADIDRGGRGVQVLVTQVDFGYDHDLQLGLAIERFINLPPPSVLMGELNTTREAPGMRQLLAMPGTQAFTVNLPSPVGSRPVDWIVTRGFDLVSSATCDTGGVSDHLLLSVTLRPMP
jgi:endonuclease/exonuclease/phosphatase family metal-dependent hydrolase